MNGPVLFIDFFNPTPYDLNSLFNQVLGGTEATVIRIAKQLSEKIPVVILQNNRTDTVKQDNVSFVPLSTEIQSSKWQAIIVIRNVPAAIALRTLFPDTPIWVWLHDLVTCAHLAYFKSMADKQIGYIVVSDFHKKQLEDLQALDPFLFRMPIIQRIYNPIALDLRPDQTEVYKNRLSFISAPIKGLHYTLQAFKLARRANPDFELWVANPGYKEGLHAQSKLEKEADNHVKFLGALPHAEAIEIVRSSLCLFYLNPLFPETFGLALAESNAVGTPVLAHPLGAVPEVILDDRQIINAYHLEKVVERLMLWHKGARPVVKVNENFRIERVIAHWQKLLKII